MVSLLLVVQTDGDNHTTCSQSAYKIQGLKNYKEACEQFNSLLRSVQQSVTYMNFDTYMTAVNNN